MSPLTPHSLRPSLPPTPVAQAFTVTATYDDTELLPEGTGTEVGRFVVQGIPAPEEGEDVPRIRVNVRHDIHGCFDVASAQFLKEKKEETPAPTPTPPATEEKKEGEGEQSEEKKEGEGEQPAEGGGESEEAKAAGAAAEGQEGEAAKEGEAAAKEEAAPPKKKKYTRVNLPCETHFLGMDAKQLMEAREAELNMQQQDRTVEGAMHARNELESYMYDFRDKMIAELASYATSEEKSQFEAKSEDLEDWLYSDEGHDCSANEYKAKHEELRAIAGPVQRRKVETEMRPPAITRLRGELERYTKQVTENVRAACLPLCVCGVCVALGCVRHGATPTHAYWLPACAAWATCTHAYWLPASLHVRHGATFPHTPPISLYPHHSRSWST